MYYRSLGEQSATELLTVSADCERFERVRNDLQLSPGGLLRRLYQVDTPRLLLAGWLLLNLYSFRLNHFRNKLIYRTNVDRKRLKDGEVEQISRIPIVLQELPLN